ncbi:MAG: chemotaxis protein CheW [Betaproteobacteria bacterium]|nr:chemotaxis protein CheW [Betaproteobacteria bacterium]
MALDLSRFAKAFFEEAAEHIHALESLLVTLDLRAPDAEALNAIFRAVHSIKGGAAAFGHTALAEFTHDFESILDRVRKGKLTLTKPMVDLFLKSGDVMRDHLVALEQETPPDPHALGVMKDALNDVVEQPAPMPAPAAPEFLAPHFRISIRLSAAQYPDAESIAELITDIGGMGEILAHETEPIDADSIELRFALLAENDADELKESLEFLVPAEAIDIVFIDVTAAAPAAETEDDETAFEFFEPLEPAPTTTAAPASTESDVALQSLVDASSIRVNVAKIDQLINLVGELVIAESMLAQAAGFIPQADQPRLTAGLAQLERNTRDLQDAVLAIRMLPISFVFSRLPRLTRDLADRLGKQIELEMLGEDTELDKSVIEKIADPLTHLVRNAIDHGIETAQDRVAAGKPAAGRLTIRAAHQGGSIVITVSDDGAGLNRERILEKARQLGLDGGDTWADEEIWQLIFTPGFSTAAEVTDVSGRGVGMDVVWQNVHALGGKVEISSMTGRGTTMVIRLPLTLAILDGMTIGVADETYILPLANVSQSLQPSPDDIKTVNGQKVVSVRGEYIPITSLARLFQLADNNADSAILVVLEMDGRRTALQVDALIGQQQVVLKSLETNFRKVKGVSGATILGDGRVALILDAGFLVSMAHTAPREKSGTMYAA